MLRRLYARSSLRQLQDEGVVLVGLAAEYDKRLFGDFVWRFSLPKQQPAGAASAGAGPQGLPYHKLQRGDSVLITWPQPGAPAAQTAQGPQGSAQRQPASPQGPLQPTGSRGAGALSGSSSEDGTESEGGEAQAANLLEGTVLQVQPQCLLVVLPRAAHSALEEVAEGKQAGGRGPGLVGLVCLHLPSLLGICVWSGLLGGGWGGCMQHGWDPNVLAALGRCPMHCRVHPGRHPCHRPAQLARCCGWTRGIKTPPRSASWTRWTGWISLATPPAGACWRAGGAERQETPVSCFAIWDPEAMTVRCFHPCESVRVVPCLPCCCAAALLDATLGTVLEATHRRGEQLVRTILLGAPATCAAQRPAWAQ